MADDTTQALVLVEPAPLATIGAAADRAAAGGVFRDYREALAKRTRMAHDRDFDRWAEYLQAAGAPPCDGWAARPECWRDVTWGLVKGFLRWQLDRGYAVTSVNRSLTTLRVYAGLAHQGGALSAEALVAIQTVKGYGRKKARHIDAGREQTRRGEKKRDFRVLGTDEIRKLKAVPDSTTPAGRRDRLMLALALDLGLRVGELEGLQVTDLDPKAGVLRFYREKVSKEQTHDLTRAALRAALAYLPDAPALGVLWRRSTRGGALGAPGWHRANIAQRVRHYGKALGIENLSPHDLRHTWATRAARKSSLDSLVQAGGWTSPAMALRYIEHAKIANKGIDLGDDE